jgi:hypothetical protein
MAKSKDKPKQDMPPVNDGHYTLVMSIDEVVSMIQILAFSKELFSQMAINAAETKDTKGQAVFTARSELSAILFSRIRALTGIGEPSSRELH